MNTNTQCWHRSVTCPDRPWRIHSSPQGGRAGPSAGPSGTVCHLPATRPLGVAPAPPGQRTGMPKRRGPPPHLSAGRLYSRAETRPEASSLGHRQLGRRVSSGSPSAFSTGHARVRRSEVAAASPEAWRRLFSPLSPSPGRMKFQSLSSSFSVLQVLEPLLRPALPLPTRAHACTRTHTRAHAHTHSRGTWRVLSSRGRVLPSSGIQ